MSCSLGWTLEEGEEPTARAVALGVALMALAAPVVALLALRERLRGSWRAARRSTSMNHMQRVADAAEELIEGLSNFVSYSSGKWQAGGKDHTLSILINEVVAWQQDRARQEREQAEAQESQQEQDARQFMRDTLGD